MTAVLPSADVLLVVGVRGHGRSWKLNGPNSANCAVHELGVDGVWFKPLKHLESLVGDDKVGLGTDNKCLSSLQIYASRVHLYLGRAF